MNEKLEERIAQLEKLVMELQSQVTTLALRTPAFSISIPAPAPAVQPLTVGPNQQPMWPPYLPYVGDPLPSDRTITWGSTTGGLGSTENGLAGGSGGLCIK